MKILFDQGVPKPLQPYLGAHDVHRAFQPGWSNKKNGELLALAEAAGFEMLVTTDQNLLHQQNLRGRKISVFPRSWQLAGDQAARGADRGRNQCYDEARSLLVCD